MKTETFLDHVQQRLGTPHRDETLDAVKATLQTFGELLSGGQAEDLAAELDDELAGYLTDHAQGQPDSLHLEDFLEKVAARQPLEVGVDQARQQVVAVFGVLGEAVSVEELRNAMAQMSKDYQTLLAGAGTF